MIIQYISDLWAYCFVEECIRYGVEHVCIAPGSRSTPLVCAVSNANLCNEPIIHYDERTLGFMALGIAKVTQKPVVIICTSGSALANLYPAVVEAYHDEIPLILATADRPQYLTGTGANQTMKQDQFFGSFVNHAEDFTEDQQSDPLSTILNRISKTLVAGCSGPVHLNFRFEEPFTPLHENNNIKARLNEVSEWCASNEPFIQESDSTRQNYDLKSSPSSKNIEVDDLLNSDFFNEPGGNLW